jgi:hypothetical protein
MTSATPHSMEFVVFNTLTELETIIQRRLDEFIRTANQGQLVGLSTVEFKIEVHF